MKTATDELIDINTVVHTVAEKNFRLILKALPRLTPNTEVNHKCHNPSQYTRFSSLYPSVISQSLRLYLYDIHLSV